MRIPSLKRDTLPGVGALPHRTQAARLDALAESIYTQPPTDWSKVTNLGQMRAVPEVKDTVNLAQQYVDLGYDPAALISRLACGRAPAPFSRRERPRSSRAVQPGRAP